MNSWTCWPFHMWATKNGLDLSTLEFGPPFHLPKLVDFSAHANSQNKMKFSALLKNCFVLQCNKMKFSVPETWIAGLVDLLLCEQKRIDWIWVPWNLDPPLYLPKLVGFSVHAYSQAASAFNVGNWTRTKHSWVFEQVLPCISSVCRQRALPTELHACMCACMCVCVYVCVCVCVC